MYEQSKELPNSKDFEGTVLGSIIIDNTLCAEAIEKLKLEDFYTPSHRHIFEAMTVLHKSGSPIEPVLVHQQLKNAGVAENVTVGDITNLALVPRSSTIEPYGSKLREFAQRRYIIKLAAAFSERARDLATPLSNSVEWVRNQAAEIECEPVRQVNTLFTRRTMNDWLESARRNLSRGNSAGSSGPKASW